MKNLNGEMIHSCLSHLKPTFHKLLARAAVPSGCLTIAFHDIKIPVCVCDIAECNSPLFIVPDGLSPDSVKDREYVVKRDFLYIFQKTIFI